MSANPKISVEEGSVLTMPTPVNITINYVPGQTITVSPDPVVLDRTTGGGNMELVWTCSDPSVDFEVIFEKKTPFHTSKFNKKANHTGKITDQANNANSPYKYTVIIDGQRLDPTVIIRP